MGSPSLALVDGMVKVRRMKSERVLFLVTLVTLSLLTISLSMSIHLNNELQQRSAEIKNYTRRSRILQEIVEDLVTGEKIGFDDSWNITGSESRCDLPIDYVELTNETHTAHRYGIHPVSKPFTWSDLILNETSP